MTSAHTSPTPVNAAPPADARPASSTRTSHLLLQVWSLTMVVFGLAIAVIPWVRGTMFSWIASGDTELTAGFSPEAADYLRFNQCLLGALTAGLGLAAFWLAREPIARGERWGWTAFVSAIGCWFVTDCVASVATGFGRNVVFNAVLVLPLVPLLWSVRPSRA